MVERLRGMFAFAIWDSRKQTLFLARDRAGKKPLHYREDPDAFRFASEPHALHVDVEDVAPDLDALHLYVHYGYVPSPRSAFSGARKLPPAHCLTWQPGGHARVRRYWKPRYVPKAEIDTTAARARAEDELREKLLEATRLRLISDVPLGAFLSGGIDSSSVVACMARLSKEPVRTFTIGFADRAYDERALAREVAKLYGTDHVERVVEPDAARVLPLLVRRYGEPFADSSAIPTYHVAEVAREKVKVALAGDAGDENFAGYLRHTANEAARVYGHVVPAPARAAILRLLEAVPHKPRARDPLRMAKRFATTFEMGPARRNAEWGLVIKTRTSALLYAADFARRTSGLDPAEPYLEKWREAEADDDTDRALWADFSLYLPDDILVKVDIATMCHGLEARAPFLDHPLVEWAARLPGREKVTLRTRKAILRRALRPWLPRILYEQPKKGFAVPLDRWFRGPLLPLLRDTLLDTRARARGLFEPAAVARLIDEHASGRAAWQHELWALLWLELWFRDQIDGRAARVAEARAAVEAREPARA
jgi:asparagine synthase (glutamine-hydrolysing)